MPQSERPAEETQAAYDKLQEIIDKREQRTTTQTRRYECKTNISKHRRRTSHGKTHTTPKRINN